MSISSTSAKIFSEGKSRLFFFSLSAVFFLLCLGVSTLWPCKLTPFYPYLGLTLIAASFFLRRLGVGLSFLLLTSLLFYLYPSLEGKMRLWQAGLHLSLGLGLLLFLLSLEEIEALFHRGEKTLDEKESQLQEKLASDAREKGRLQAEVMRLETLLAQKGEEQKQTLRNLELFSSEIELLTSQKEEILLSAREGGNSQECARLQGLYKQLRVQFEEKAKVLYQTRKELFKVEGKLEVREIEEKEQLLEPIYVMEKELGILLEENLAKDEEIHHLEELISHILSQ